MVGGQSMKSGKHIDKTNLKVSKPAKDISPYQQLANAIVLQAARDYQSAIYILKRESDDYKMQSLKNEIERFVKSDYFAILTSIDGEEVLYRIRKEMGYYNY